MCRFVGGKIILTGNSSVVRNARNRKVTVGGKEGFLCSGFTLKT